MGGSSEKVLVFFKLHPTVITEDNLHQSILVSSMLDSPINSLYQAVRQVFAPVLLKVKFISVIPESLIFCIHSWNFNIKKGNFQ